MSRLLETQQCLQKNKTCKEKKKYKTSFKDCQLKTAHPAQIFTSWESIVFLFLCFVSVNCN